MHFDRYFMGLLTLVTATILLLSFPAYLHFVAVRVPGFILPPQLVTIGFFEARLALAFAVFMAGLVLVFAAVHWREATSIKGATVLVLTLVLLTVGPLWYYRANIVEHRVTEGEIERDRTIAKLSSDLATASDEISDLRADLETFSQKASELRATNVRLYPYRFRSQSQLVKENISIAPRNNPFLADKTAIRSIKKSATSMAGMWDALIPYAARYHQFNDGRDMAIGAMLVVGAFYDLGNPFPNDEKGGCVSINQYTDHKSIGDLTFNAMTKSDIGCCTDFTLMLISFLRHLDYDVNAVITAGHQAAQINIDGYSHFIDANTLIFAEDYFSGVSRKLIYFTPYERSRVQQFQHYELTSLAFGLEHFAPTDWKFRDPDEHAKLFQAYFLVEDVDTSAVK